jgi:60 kDa SS-A/Ro ribonucleoprotein
MVEVSRATAIVRWARLLHLRIGNKAKKLAAVAERLMHVQLATSEMYGYDPAVALDQIVAIKDGGEKEAYCVSVEPSQVFLANGIVTGNCLRNLNNAIKYSVPGHEETLDYICATLGDPERSAKSKQLPFRFVSALKAIEGQSGEGAERLRAVLSDALEISFANMPEQGARVLIANEIRGTMSAKTSSRSDMSMTEIAGVFAAVAFKKAAESEIVSVDTEAQPRDVTKSQWLTEIAQAISGHSGGTSLSAPLEYAFAGTGVYDVAIFLTDSESRVDHLTKNRGSLDLIREYKQRINPSLKCFFVQLLPYQHAVTPQDEPDCYYLYGWNSSMLNLIGAMIAGGESQVEAVRQVSAP